MREILKKIIDHKRIEVGELRKQRRHFEVSQVVHRPFLKSLNDAPSMAVIAEVKKASPSKGIIRSDFDPQKIATKYEKGGAHAVSVITDENFFQGSLEYLQIVKNAISLPVLRKDFIIDTLQVEQSAWAGADAMLLIVAALDKAQLRDLFQAALSLGLEPLIEVHTHHEFETAMNLEPSLIGINNRNLDTFKTDLSTTLSIIKIIPSSVTVIAESGIENGEQARSLKAAGVKALLVGESLVKKEEPGDLIRELTCTGDIQ